MKLYVVGTPVMTGKSARMKHHLAEQESRTVAICPIVVPLERHSRPMAMPGILGIYRDKLCERCRTIARSKAIQKVRAESGWGKS